MVVHAYYPLAETRVERQAVALRTSGLEVDVICLRGSAQPALETINGVTIYRLPVRRHKVAGMAVQLLEYLMFFGFVFARLTKLYFQKHYAIVHIHNLPDFLVFAALIPKLAGAKIILDLHDLMPEFYAERFQQPMSSAPVRMIRWQEGLSCRFADHVITVTGLWRQALIERGQPPEKISVVMNVADDRIFHPKAAASPPNDHEGRLRLIYHGNMDRRYGLDLVLKAIDLVRETAPGIHLTLHGGGEYRKTLEAMVEELGLAEHVQFSRHFVPTEELPKLIQAAHVGIVPYRDGLFTGAILPTKLMEYAALGVPTIAARTPTISAYFDDTMLEFFPPGDVEELARCIQRLFNDRERLADLGRNIRRFYERYSWSEQSVNYLNLVERLIGPGPYTKTRLTT
jgi:glycosyltransferase involved in cell wall biosynthesis